MTQLTIAAVQSDIGQRIAKKFGIKQTDLRVLLSNPDYSPEPRF